jgi:hypothetical protein
MHGEKREKKGMYEDRERVRENVTIARAIVVVGPRDH